MRQYHQAIGVRAQRSILLRSYDSLSAALSDSIFLPDGDECYLVLSRRGVLFELNLVASLLWELIAEPIQFRDAVEALQAVFDIQFDILERDLQLTLFMLIDQGLVEVVNPYTGTKSHSVPPTSAK